MIGGTAAPAKLYTAEDLESLGDSFRGELVDGHLVEMSPTNLEHSFVEANITVLLKQWCKAHAPHLKVGSGEVGFVLARGPDIVRGADVALVTREQASRKAGGFVEGAPYLAVEVLSPGNTASEMEQKLDDYFRAGTKSVWIVDPATKKVVVGRSLRERDVFALGDTLTDPALPGFAASVADVFEE